MNSSSPPTPSTRAPAGLPPSGNSKNIVIFVVLIVLIVAVIAFKTCGSGTPTPPPKPITAFDAAPVSHEENSVPLPPPPEEPVPDSGPTRVTQAFDPCSARSCSGSTTPELETQIAYRAKQAHRCYDTALAQDSTLQGHVTLRVKIGSNGAVCSAAVASNDMGTDSVANCVANVFRTSHSFPPPKGVCTEVNVPISFVSGGK